MALGFTAKTSQANSLVVADTPEWTSSLNCFTMAAVIHHIALLGFILRILCKWYIKFWLFPAFFNTSIAVGEIIYLISSHFLPIIFSNFKYCCFSPPALFQNDLSLFLSIEKLMMFLISSKVLMTSPTPSSS